ncbi:hypothetical protein pipiens_007129 [Culex pipiens pipiens]|uniref:Chitin-binding type-2 domain-containing protein n=1 Tax=Culex pipiens pipiens TaxID=38569 RepID=A0ABD1DM15_CULPP
MWSAAFLVTTLLLLTRAQTPDAEARCARVSFAFFANETDCGRFLFCNDGQPMDIECREDEIWRQQEAACVLGNRETCTVWDPAEACVGLGNGPIAYPGYCERYILCDEGRANVNYCPVGFIFSEGDQRCIIGSVATCETYEHLCRSGPYSRFRHPDFCESFIQCDNQTALLYSCGFQEMYQPNVGNCIAGEDCEPRPVSEVCDGRNDGYVAHPEECGSFIKCFGGIPDVTPCPDGQIFRDGFCVPGSRTTCQTLDGMCANRGNYEQLVHPDGCAYYVECFGGVANVRSCPTGKIFRHDMQFCIPGDADTCEAAPIAEMCHDSPYGVIFPHPEDCSQLIRCNGTAALEEPCPEHHIVQPGSLNCIPGLFETCESFDEICRGRFDDRIAHPSCDQFVHCQNEKALILLCTPGEIFSTLEQKCIPGDTEQCEALSCSTRQDGLYPHPNLCHGFYQCSNERVSSHLCPLGHIFDPAARVCTPGDLATCQPDPLETMCKNRFDGLRYPHPEGFDCERFVVCQNREALVGSCPAGAVLRPQFLDCVPGDEESCEAFEDVCPEGFDIVLAHPGRCDVLIVCEEGSATVESCPEGEIVDRDSLECVPGGINDCFPVENLCEGREDGLFEDASSCSRFIECESERMTALECPTDYVFVQELQGCVPGDTQACTNICTEQENDVMLENPSSCVEYYRCNEGLPIAESCEIGNIFINTICAPGSADTCEDFSDRCVDQPDGRLEFPETSQCSLYLECSSEVTSVGTCKEGTVFVAELEQCVAGDATACTNLCTGQEDDSLLPNPDSCAEYFRCAGGIPNSETCPPDHIFDEPSGSCIPGSVTSCEDFSERCVGQPDGLLPHPDSARCDRFLACSVESVTLGSCPEGEVFSEAAQLCVPGDAEQCTEDADYNFCEGLEDGSYAHPQVCYLFVGCESGSAQVGACGSDEPKNFGSFALSLSREKTTKKSELIPFPTSSFGNVLANAPIKGDVTPPRCV